MASFVQRRVAMKRRLLLALLGFGFKMWLSRRPVVRTLGPIKRPQVTAPDGSDQAMRRFIGYVVLPVWLAAGFLDYVWHRRTKIETTSGLSESLLHTVMMIEAGPAVMGALFLEVNAGVLAMLVSAAVLHELTAICDVVYTSPKRLIGPARQHTHSFLEMIPFCVASVAIAIHWEQALALIGRGSQRPDYRFRLRHPSIAWEYQVLVFGGFILLGALPHSDELRRCVQARQQRLLEA